MRASVTAVATVVLVTSLALSEEKKSAPARMRIQQPGILVIAHRGDSGSYPENTLPAFQAAIKAKSDFIELDYYHSKDGIPVVFHDKTLDRTTNAVKIWGEQKIAIGSKTFEQLRQLDAGSWFDARYAGIKIPTLEESLDVIQTGSYTLVERKAGDAATCVRILKEKNLLGEVAVQAFDWKFVKDCHALAPELALGALGSKELTADRLDEIANTGAMFIGWKHDDLTREAVEAAKARGLKVWVYTVDESADATRVINLGVDGIITNEPRKIRSLVERSRVPAPQPKVPVPAVAP